MNPQLRSSDRLNCTECINLNVDTPSFRKEWTWKSPVSGITPTTSGLTQVLNSSPTDRFAPRRIAPIHAVIVCALLNVFSPGLWAEEQPFPTEGVQVNKAFVDFIDDSTLASARLGIIKKLYVREGDLVNKDDPLLELDDRVAAAQYRTAREEAKNTVEIEFANASMKVAKAEYELNLQANLRVPGAVPLIEVERLQLQYERALLQIKQARHQQQVNILKSEEAAQVKDTYLVKAEFPGVVTKVEKFVGEGVREGDSILSISDPSRVKVQGFIHTADVFRIKKGDPVKVKIDIPDFDTPHEEFIFDGKLVFIDNSVDSVKFDEVQVWAEVTNEFENDQPILRKGFLTRMIILTDVPPPRPKAIPKTTMVDLQHLPVLR